MIQKLRGLRPRLSDSPLDAIEVVAHKLNEVIDVLNQQQSSSDSVIAKYNSSRLAKSLVYTMLKILGEQPPFSQIEITNLELDSDTQKLSVSYEFIPAKPR